MKIQTIKANVYGEESVFEAIQYDFSDISKLKNTFDAWINLKQQSKILHGRSPNIPECISETCLCFVANMVRFYKSKKLKSSSFDCFDLVKQKAGQAKTGSILKDLTTFSPKPKWDILYFLDFYNDGNLDGTFKFYEIPDEYIFNWPVNSMFTFKEIVENNKNKKGPGARPHVNMKELIEKYSLKPVDVTQNKDLMENILIPNGFESVEKGIKLW